MKDSYMTFSEFNKEYYDENEKQSSSQPSQQSSQASSQIKLPIRQHITQPRNPSSINQSSHPNQPYPLPILARNDNYTYDGYNEEYTNGYNNIRQQPYISEMYQLPSPPLQYQQLLPSHYQQPQHYQQQQQPYISEMNQPQPYISEMNQPQPQPPSSYYQQQNTTPLLSHSQQNMLSPQQKTTPISYAITYDEKKDDFSQAPSHSHPTCIDVNVHITDCPICSNYYKNYTLIYLSIIAFLIGVIILFLLKKIWEK
jgi:hypothetical protein